jgi:hypothetical protein
VARVEANADTIRISKRFQDSGQLLEPGSETAALASGVFQQNGDRRFNRINGLTQRLGDPGHTCMNTGAHMRAGMHDQIGHSQVIGALHFFDEGVERFPVQFAVRGREVDEIAVVAHHRIDAAFSMRLPKQDLIFLGQESRLPLVAAFEKNLDGLAAHLFAAIESQVHPTGNRHVSAHQQFIHGNVLK